ncbi:MAG: LysR family transcriptional regulator [Rhizobiaceae bacterium]
MLSFVKAGETGSFAKAAAALGVTSAAISKNVQRLEKSLSVRLFNRSTRGMTLTEDGRFLFERYRHALDEIDQASLELSQRRDTLAGPLRMVVQRAFGLQVIMPLIPEFSRRYPDITVEMDFENQAGDLALGKFDLGIRSGSVEQGNLIAKRLARMVFKIYASPAYLALRSTPVSPEDLRAHRCIGYRNPTTGRLISWDFTSGDAKISVDIEPTLIVNTQEASRDAAVMGMGIVRLDDFFARPLLASGQLVHILPQFVSRSDFYYVYYSSRRSQTRRAKVFINYVSEALRTPSQTTERRSR